MSRLLRAGLGDVALELATAGFAALWEGQAVRPEELAPGRAARARRAAAELVRRAEVDDEGRLVGVHGLTLRSTRHAFVHAGHTHWTWCAFDAIGIPAALAVDAEARTTCTACGGALRVPIRRGRPDVSEIVLWLPSASVNMAHLMTDFCAVTDLYCRREHLEQRVDTARQPGEVLDLDRAAALGTTAWADIAGPDLVDNSGRRSESS